MEPSLFLKVISVLVTSHFSDAYQNILTSDSSPAWIDWVDVPTWKSSIISLVPMATICIALYHNYR